MGGSIEGLFGCVKEANDLSFVGDVGLNGDCSWGCGGGGGRREGIDLGNELFGEGLGRWRRVVDDEFCAE